MNKFDTWMLKRIVRKQLRTKNNALGKRLTAVYRVIREVVSSEFPKDKKDMVKNFLEVCHRKGMKGTNE